MEQDRYQQNHKLFIIGLASLVISLSLFALSFYIMPNLLFGWGYDTPEFITNFVEWFQYTYNYSESAASKLVFLIVFVLASIFASIAYYCSNRIDNQIYSLELQESKQLQKVQTTDREGLRLVLKILFITLLIFLAAALFEWFIYTPPQPAQLSNSVTIGAKGN